MTMISIKPSEILFCQENIDGKFGRGSNISLLDTFKKLVSGEMTPSDLPKITVVSYEGKYYVYDGHRRLFLFKKLAEAGKIRTINVLLKNLWLEKFLERFDTASAGRSVRVRHPPSLEKEIDYIVFNCRQEQRMRSQQQQQEARSSCEQPRNNVNYERCYNYIDSFNYPEWTRNALKVAVILYNTNRHDR